MRGKLVRRCYVIAGDPSGTVCTGSPSDACGATFGWAGARRAPAASDNERSSVMPPLSPKGDISPDGGDAIKRAVGMCAEEGLYSGVHSKDYEEIELDSYRNRKKGFLYKGGKGVKNLKIIGFEEYTDGGCYVDYLERGSDHGHTQYFCGSKEALAYIEANACKWDYFRLATTQSFILGTPKEVKR